MQWVIGIWALIATIAALNLCAAGGVAILHTRRSALSHSARVLMALAVTGLIPSSLFVVAGAGVALDGGYAGPVWSWMLWFATAFSISAAAASPGAIIVARKLDAPGDDYRAFE